MASMLGLCLAASLMADLNLAIRCYAGVSFQANRLLSTVKQHNCSFSSDKCRATTLVYNDNNAYGFETHTNFICDKKRFPCDMWCQMQMSIDHTIQTCKTFCCSTDFCNKPADNIHLKGNTFKNNSKNNDDDDDDNKDDGDDENFRKEESDNGKEEQKKNDEVDYDGDNDNKKGDKYKGGENYSGDTNYNKSNDEDDEEEVIEAEIPFLLDKDKESATKNQVTGNQNNSTKHFSNVTLIFFMTLYVIIL
ncbi:protein PFC0760c-like [Hydractinia symbiolongicarpus]|uniref:protein PFC0760c-like n=1 Tax=Hydractinia symbiolongicarpus TaxID=13093 RepID=UPI002551B0D3|nr:protein PFC0760c-like [Hydractinia symbiolongicarpus]XP_057305556.1 protein PFC0760c-like [Hydractinia symbiolongicarpus]